MNDKTYTMLEEDLQNRLSLIGSAFDVGSPEDETIIKQVVSLAQILTTADKIENEYLTNADRKAIEEMKISVDRLDKEKRRDLEEMKIKQDDEKISIEKEKLKLDEVKIDNDRLDKEKREEIDNKKLAQEIEKVLIERERLKLEETRIEVDRLEKEKRREIDRLKITQEDNKLDVENEKLDLERQKLEIDRLEKEERRRIDEKRNDETIQNEKDKQDLTWKKVGLELTKTMAPLVISMFGYNLFQKRIIRFEETGRLTSTASRELHLPKFLK